MRRRLKPAASERGNGEIFPHSRLSAGFLPNISLKNENVLISAFPHYPFERGAEQGAVSAKRKIGEIESSGRQTIEESE